MNSRHSPAPPVSVVVPCHNPRRDYLERVLTALRRQTLPADQWELLVVDNASDEQLSAWADLAWHARGRIVREETLGLTAARLRGFAETAGQLIVMVDDDNELRADYLEQAALLAREKPFLGVFGGLIVPEFECEPAPWTRPYLGMLGVRDVPCSVWSNDINHWPSTPIGAGLCVCRDVAVQYERLLEGAPLRKSLGRQGSSLVSGEDMDIAFTAVAMGYGMGVFQELKLTHLIPEGRLTDAYLFRLSEAIGYSAAILDALWGRSGHTEQGFPSTGALARHAVALCVKRWKQRRYMTARRRGVARGKRRLAELARNGMRIAQDRGPLSDTEPRDGSPP
jgi:hypothetical protein